MKLAGGESGRAACREVGGHLWTGGRVPPPAPGPIGRPPRGPPAWLSVGEGGPASGWRAGCVIGSLEPAAPALAGGAQSKSARPPRCQGREQTHGSCSAPAGWASAPAGFPRSQPAPHPGPLHVLTVMANYTSCLLGTFFVLSTVLEVFELY